MDTFTPEQRRLCMLHNKSKNTKPELTLRKALCNSGLKGYRLHWKIAGKPDIVYPGHKLAIFVNGCFWHRCPYCNPSVPKTNLEYWIKKFHSNTERDRKNYKLLQDNGWTVIIVWECQIKNNLPYIVKMIEYSIKKMKD